MLGGFMQSQTLFGRLAIAAFIVLYATLSHGQEGWSFPDFSATQVFDSKKGEMSMKVYRSGSNVRVERSGALSTLYMPSSSKVYNFTTYPDNSRQCVVMKSDQAKMLPSPLELLQGSNLKRTPAGMEVVEGHTCKVDDVVVTRPDGKTVESKVWEAQDLKGIPVKIESHIGDTTLTAVYRDVSIGTTNKDLFTVPEKCTPFEKMWQVVEQATLR
jgi:hypothetical protein